MSTIMSRYSNGRQLKVDNLISTYVVEDRLHQGRFYEVKLFKPLATPFSSPVKNKQQNNQNSNVRQFGIVADSSASYQLWVPQESKATSATITRTTTDYLQLLSSLTTICHPFVAQYFAVFVQSGTVYVISEHANLGHVDLLVDEYVHMSQLLNELLVLRWITQLLLGIIYIEQQTSISITRISTRSASLFDNGRDYSTAKLVDVEVRTEKFVTLIQM